MDFIIKLPALRELIIGVEYNLVLTIIDRLIKKV